MSDVNTNWLLVNHLDHGGTGTLSTISQSDDQSGFTVNQLTDSATSGLEHVPWFLGIHDNGQVILFDPANKTVSLADKAPADAYPAYSYKDHTSTNIWFMNDGDKETGNDPLNCGDNGSTVTIIRQGTTPEHIKTLCVGRGHHVTTFTGPTNNHPELKKLAFVSNLLDGTICVVDNDENNTETYLTIIHTINLCEPEKEKDGNNGFPNNAFPHGKQYSDITGKIYSLNNGYGTVAVINPVSYEIEARIKLKGYSNLLLSPDGKFIIGKGADRKSNEQHVLGRLSVIDISTQEVVSEIEIPDFYPSTYRFSPNGQKLYVTSAATGKGEQKENLDINILYVYDTSDLPTLKLHKTIKTGSSDCGRRPVAFPIESAASRIFIPNPTDATVSVLNADTDEIIETLKIADTGGKEFNFSFWKNGIYGA